MRIDERKARKGGGKEEKMEEWMQEIKGRRGKKKIERLRYKRQVSKVKILPGG